jgi:hypothetical protein
MLTNALYAVKEVTITALSSMMVTTKYKGLTSDTAQPIATIHAPQHSTISGMPAWVTLDSYKNCKIIIDNCAPCDIILPRNEVLGVLEFEPEQCLPLNEDTVAPIISNIEQTFPNVTKKHFWIAFDPFTPDLQLLQCQDQDLQAIFQFLKNGDWHSSLSKHKI